MKDPEKQRKIALPVQAPPVRRDGWNAPAAQNSGDGIEAAARCADMTGIARQMCFARGGLAA
ncbi:hypothetical protein [Streptomyces chattanoogensis]|uniref:Uncharacterized protein n=1 Tax=Streptomyces chattanoogensis TaxID=66876 RepID=A0A0N0H1H7_9ACTN|nr:hypothetical protein [Streptomyces chattanoogensis]KPC64250.1 hypothetical protein ADL29_11970 [Streptomyces chattanoogensis]